VEIFKEYLSINGIDKNAETELLKFLEWAEPYEDDFALDVRIILVSTDFSREITTSVLWLNDRDLDIRCIRYIPYKHNNQILVEVQQIIPLPEVENYQIKIRQQTVARRESRESSRDLTRYIFKGVEYNKRKLVLAVVQDWVKENNPKNINELTDAFPQDISSYKVFKKESEAIDIFDRTGIVRHFLGQNEIIVFPDSSRYALSNQWGLREILAFLDRARSLGCEITERD
ncbi:hypothetical protein KKB99_03015, partial [bacterium]|nr:hypothetical protein [bacterium]MBU1024960.1 hypothetical protein [bacterium]